MLLNVHIDLRYKLFFYKHIATSRHTEVYIYMAYRACPAKYQSWQIVCVSLFEHNSVCVCVCVFVLLTNAWETLLCTAVTMCAYVRERKKERECVCEACAQHKCSPAKKVHCTMHMEANNEWGFLKATKEHLANIQVRPHDMDSLNNDEQPFDL